MSVIAVEADKESFKDSLPGNAGRFSVSKLFGTVLASRSGELVDTTGSLSSASVIGIYFSAHWCPPCRIFTPKLCEKYLKLKEAGKKFEIVFVSSDTSKDAFDEYHHTMPFFTVPFDDHKRRRSLRNETYDIRGIPSLVFVDATSGLPITKRGRERISADSYIDDFPYYPKPCYDLSENTEGLNDSTSILVLMDHASSEVQSKVTEVVALVAEKHFEKFKFFTGKGGGPLSNIRKLTNANRWGKHAHPLLCLGKGSHGWYCDGCDGGGPDFLRHQCAEGCDFDYCEACLAKSIETLPEEMKAPVMIMLDFGKSKAYYKPAEGFETVNEENLISFMEAYTNGNLKKCAVKDV